MGLQVGAGRMLCPPVPMGPGHITPWGLCSQTESILLASVVQGPACIGASKRPRSPWLCKPSPVWCASHSNAQTASGGIQGGTPRPSIRPSGRSSLGAYCELGAGGSAVNKKNNTVLRLRSLVLVGKTDNKQTSR